MKRISSYYIAHVVLNLVLLVVFRANIVIDSLSVVPVFLIALMLIQAPMFKVDIHRNSLGDTAYSTGNTVRLTDDELEKQYKYTRYAFYGLIPFVFPFIFFFSSYAKLCSIIPYILAYVVGNVFFKFKYGKTIKTRLETEKEELRKQLQNEELGIK